jgi:hypothetical protein
VILVGARLGQNLDSPETGAVVFGRERVLIHANLTDGRLRRNHASAEAIDVDLAAVGSRGWPGEHLKRIRQILGVVRK